MDQKKRTEIASLGQFGLIDLLTSGFTPKNASTLKGAGDDAAVIAPGRGEAVLCTTDSFYEGVDFDLTYFPLKHLGYKAVTAGVSDILAMNALPAQITVSLGVSSKLPVEALQDLYEGIAFACKEQELDLVCITGNLGAAYMGLQLLEREKRVLADVENPEPQFKGYEYLLEKYLKPRPRTDIVRTLAEEKIRPTSMIDLSDGLASDLMQICKSSACGARIYLERIPIARQTSDTVVAALNGGEDYELLFTVPLSMQEQIMRLGLVDVIGHITPASTGCYLVTPDGQDIKLKAQGFPEE